MVAERRFGPLIAVLFGLLAILLVRLFHVQVLEHEVWAGEAASLVRNSQLLPSHRGRILDRAGRIFVEDEDVSRVDFVYRDFRRENALGIVAHARSTLEMRPVPLAEALTNLVPWGKELARLSMADIDSFGRTGALAAQGISAPAAKDLDPEHCRSRASDLRYYVWALLHVGPAERKRMREAHVDPKSSQPYLEDLAAFRKTTSEDLLAALATELSTERERLAQLAALLPGPEKSSPERAGPEKGSTPAVETVDSLLARMEAARARFEDAAADELFQEATGFVPGRISTASLVRVFDLRWLARILRWDGARLHAWEASRRAAFGEDLDQILVPRILVGAGLDDPSSAGERLLDGLAELYAQGDPPESWRDLKRLCVLADIPSLFDLPRTPGWEVMDRPGMPLADADLRRIPAQVDDPWLVLGTLAETAGARLGPPAPAGSAREWTARWEAIAGKDSHLEGSEAHAALGAILAALEARLLAASDAGLEACLAAAVSGDGTAEPLSLTRARVDQAKQKERFLLKDLSSRPVNLAADATYALVHLLERHADRYCGFEVRPSTRRKIQARASDGLPVARMLIGGVRGPSLHDSMVQEKTRRRVLSGAYEDEEEAAETLGRIARADERTGSYGVEALFDAELRGKNGWFETSGLDEGNSTGSVKGAVDGKDVVLTIDLDLQSAAQETLAHPEVLDNSTPDTIWLQHPVGAIVLITPEGDVLVAASEPTQDGLSPTPGRDLERSHARERTLTRPVFNPPGSVFKPFVAAYALDRVGLDPGERFACVPLADGGYGYEDSHGKMHCHVGGHGQSNLAEALVVSCNATFAQIGERFEGEQLLEMADLFGFGHPTGICHVPIEAGGRRGGLREDGELKNLPMLPKQLRHEANRMRFANGLTFIEVTPMQVARAMAALVTGKLPELRIALKIADEEIAHASSDLPISPRAREIVCQALQGVVNDSHGTAHNKGLDRASLGFSFACKTGSADTKEIVGIDGAPSERKDGQKKMRKQTWIAGWFPVEAPKAILVVMLHDVTVNSDHSSVYVAAQFLHSPAVKRFVEGASPAPSKAEGGADPAAPALDGGGDASGGPPSARKGGDR